MLPQNNGRMQKPGDAGRLGDTHQFAGRIEQPDEGQGLGIRDSGFALCIPRIPNPQSRTHVLAVAGAANAVGRQFHDRKAPQHLRERNHPLRGRIRIALGRVQRHRVVDRVIAAAGAAQFGKAGVSPERFGQVIDESPDIRTFGNLRGKMDEVAFFFAEFRRKAVSEILHLLLVLAILFFQYLYLFNF